MFDILEIIETMPITDIVAMVEITVIVVGVTLSALVLRARARMKRVQAARMLSVWVGAIIVRLDQHYKNNVNLANIILPTHIYDGLVTSGLIAQFDEDVQADIDYLYQLVYVHNNDRDAKRREGRLSEMTNSASKLYDVVAKLKKEHRSRLRIIARLFD